MDKTTRSVRPLEGLRILDFSRVLSGPTATMVLADLGAHVIKVEDLDGTDTTRHNPPFVNGESHYFLSLNRNKEGLAIDLKRPEGLEIALRLAEQSDVIVENFRPGVADRIGIGLRSLTALNPALIYCSLAGFGQTGPLRNKTAYDLVIQALTGAISITGEPDRPPAKMGLPLADELSGIFAGIGILAALEKRERTGRGTYLDVAMFDVGISLLGYMASVYFATGESAQRLGSTHQTIYPYNAFQTRDGYIVVASFTQVFWRKFAAAIGRLDLSENPRYATFADRHKNRSELGAILEPIMRLHSTAEWEVLLAEGDVPNGPVNSIAEALEMEQTKARGMVVEMDHPVSGRLRTLGSPFHFDFEGEAQFDFKLSPPPMLGQHSQSILSDLLGYDEQRVADLGKSGVIGISAVAGKTTASARPRPLPAKATTAEEDLGLPLAGIRVLDLTRMFAGPFGTMILADLGAEVIKIEEPRIGDPTRRNIPFVKDESTYFMALNRGKKSVVLDLKVPQARQIFLDLVKETDVVIENYRAGVMERLGLSYAALREVNPHVILCSISGYGQTGPLREKISFDLVNQAMAGTMAITGEEGRPPVRIGLPVGDLNGGIFSAFAILAALRERRNSGKGAAIDLGLHDLLIALLGYLAQLYFVTGESPKAVGSGHHHIAPYRAFEASDGYFVVAAFSQEFWVKFARAIERPELADEPRFCSIAARKEHMEALNSLLEPIFRGRTVAQWIGRFDAGDVPSATVASIGEVLNSEQAQARGMVLEFNHPRAGKVKVVGTPFRTDGGLWRTSAPPPMLGEHTDAVLKEVLRYSEVKLAELRALKAIG